jgi:lipoprotein-anchoring transpeptidase ErfK/SrfK
MKPVPGWVVRVGVIVAIVIALNFVFGTTIKQAPIATSPATAENVGPVPQRIFLSDKKATPQLQGRAISSILNVREPMQYGQFVWDEEGVPPGEIWIRVDLSKQLLSVFKGGQEIGTAVIMYGADEKPTPIGQFSVLWMKEHHQSSLYDAEMPYTLRLTNDGVAIHGADVRSRSATHGCVSVPIAFAKLLFAKAAIGDVVTILPATPDVSHS